MPRFIVEIRNPDDESDRRLLEWSTVVDAPVTYGMTEAQFRASYREEYGSRGMLGLDARLERVRQHGTSCVEPCTVEYLTAGNRAGPNETCADAALIWRLYVTEAPAQDGSE
jgi:hypothetical protein